MNMSAMSVVEDLQLANYLGSRPGIAVLVGDITFKGSHLNNWKINCF